jgi:methionyl-tRNA synthetase
LVRRTNQYLEQSKPWILARPPEKEKELDTVLFSAAEALRLLSIYLAPFIPDASDRIRSQLGLEPVQSSAWVREATWGGVPLEKVIPGPLLFPRIEGS